MINFQWLTTWLHPHRCPPPWRCQSGRVGAQTAWLGQFVKLHAIQVFREASCNAQCTQKNWQWSLKMDSLLLDSGRKSANKRHCKSTIFSIYVKLPGCITNFYGSYLYTPTPSKFYSPPLKTYHFWKESSFPTIILQGLHISVRWCICLHIYLFFIGWTT